MRLETSYARISELKVDYQLNADLNKVIGHIIAITERSSGAKVKLAIRLDQSTEFEHIVSVGSDGSATATFEISNPKLWYPHGYGEQPLYTCEATLITSDGDQLDISSKKTGFRRGQLIQEPDEVGKTFYFRINNVDVFCGGSDWIPADSFTPRITEKRYRSWLQTMIDGYQVMIRYVLRSDPFLRRSANHERQNLGWWHLGRRRLLRHL